MPANNNTPIVRRPIALAFAGVAALSLLFARPWVDNSSVNSHNITAITNIQEPRQLVDWGNLPAEAREHIVIEGLAEHIAVILGPAQSGKWYKVSEWLEEKGVRHANPRDIWRRIDGSHAATYLAYRLATYQYILENNGKAAADEWQAIAMQLLPAQSP